MRYPPLASAVSDFDLLATVEKALEKRDVYRVRSRLSQLQLRCEHAGCQPHPAVAERAAALGKAADALEGEREKLVEGEPASPLNYARSSL